MANRDVTAAFKTELTAGINYPFFLAELALDGITLRYSTLDRDITWNSQTWQGNGHLKEIPSVSENKGVEAAGLSLKLVGEPNVIISTILNNSTHNSTLKFWFGFLTSSGVVISHPHQLFFGKLSTAELQDDVDESSIILTFENQLVNVLNNNEFRYNTKTQQLFYPSDLGFEYMEALADWSGFWGRRTPKRKKKKRKRGKR